MTDTGYRCCGGSACCGAPQDSEMGRRTFLKGAAAAGVAGALTSRAGHGADSDRLAAWMASLRERGERRIYRGDELEHIGFPLGGFGAGQVYLTGRGTLNPWQVVNNFNLHASVDGGFFAVRTETESGDVVVRGLHEGDGGGFPGVTAVEFAGEYPFAWLTYLDGSLPVRVHLESYSPFIPQNGKDSALPAAVFRFTVQNPGKERVRVELLGSVPNLAGWDGYSPITGVRHREFEGNESRLSRDRDMTRLDMGTGTGTADRMAPAVHLYTNDQGAAYPLRDTEGVYLHWPEELPDGAGAGDVLWLDDASRELASGQLGRILDQVASGAAVILTGFENSVLAQIDQAENATATHVFADFEDGTYSGWTATGDAFGPAPSTGINGPQNPVSGWAGQYFVNTFSGADTTTGRLTSRPFVIKERYIHLLVGGGNHRGETCIDLRIDGETVQSAMGRATEILQPVTWDLAAYSGREAVLEIVDDHSGGWGHILVDHIVFSDSPAVPFIEPAAAKAMRDAMPFTWSHAEPYEDACALEAGPLTAGLKHTPPMAQRRWVARNLALKPGAEVLARSADGDVLAVSAPHGKGRITVVFGEPQHWMAGHDGKTLAGNLVAYSAGSRYTAQTGVPESSAHYGTLSLAVLGSADGTAMDWADSAALAQAFRESTAFVPHESAPSPPGETRCGALRAPVLLRPGEERTVTFVVAWHFPNRKRDDRYGWGPAPMTHDYRLGNQYNNWFADATEVVSYVAGEFERLDRETHLFHETFYDSTLPRYLLDAVTANTAILRSPVYVWLEDGTVGGFEGADHCCPMNCTHVFNYVMTTGFLFPEWERNVRETDLLVQMHPTEHYIPHRTKLPLSVERLGFEIGGPHHPALDGELGTLLKTYREYRLSGDTAWLTTLWDRARTHLRYLIETHESDGAGLIRGEQPNTYDIHTFGSNTFIGSLYLATLRAMEEMARVMNDRETETLCAARYAASTAAYDQACWNGEYYVNVFDAPNADEATYNRGNCWGPGCHADQLFGQYWAHMLGLGPVLPRDHVRKALASLFQYCFKYTLTHHRHSQRVFAIGDEMGLLNCTWPKSGRPDHPVFYCDEVWTGIEYHVAATMLFEGMTDEALQIVRAVRDRYTGDNRNPWAELECGYHYTRAMSSYGLLHGSAGFAYDRSTGVMAFDPRLSEDEFRCFFSGGTGWGTLSQRLDGESAAMSVTVRYGEIPVQQVTWARAAAATRIHLNGKRIAHQLADGTIGLETEVVLKAGDTLTVENQ